ncbi:hypothetical protein V5799_007520 [Amblyomma americanum]|uniref:Secreted protein n=1 Tax=Amblyomma americanum TaxID=6943 RepID=A0AAQ4FGM6_AMBAM
MMFKMLCMLFALAEATNLRPSITASGVQYINDQPENPYRVVYDDIPRFALRGGQSVKAHEDKKLSHYALQTQEQRPYLHSGRIQTSALSLQTAAKHPLSSAATTKKHQSTSLLQQRVPEVTIGQQAPILYSQGSLSGYAMPQHILAQAVTGGPATDYLRGGATYAPTSDIAQYANALQSYTQQLGYPTTFAQNQGHSSAGPAADPAQYYQPAYYVPSLPRSTYSVPTVATQAVAGQTGGGVHVQASLPENGGYATGSAAAQAGQNGQNGLIYPPRYSSGSPGSTVPAYAGADGKTSTKAVNDLNVPSAYYPKSSVPPQGTPIGAAQGLYSHPYQYPVTYVPYRYPVQPAAQVPPTHTVVSPAQPSYSVPAAGYPTYVQPHIPAGTIQPYYAQQDAYVNQSPSQANQDQLAFGGPTRTIYSLPGPIPSAHRRPSTKLPIQPVAPPAEQAESPAYGSSFGDIGYTAASIYGTPMYSKASPNPFLLKYVNAPDAYFPKGVVSDSAGNVYIHGPRGPTALHPSHVAPSGQGHYASAGVQYVPADKAYDYGRFVTMHAGKDGVRYIKK